MKFETLQIHSGQEQPAPATDAKAVPIYATTSHVFKNSYQAAGRFAVTEAGNIYTMLTNPTTDVFEKRITALEGGAGALATVSGSAAISYAVKNIASAGDNIVSSANLYGSTRNLFAHTLREQGLSSPNPSYHGIVFTEACGSLAYRVKLRTTLMRDQGASISPFNSFLLLQGLETLSLRVDRHLENALKSVSFLTSHPMVVKVNHPSLSEGRQKELYDRHFPNGAGSIFTFDIKGCPETEKVHRKPKAVFPL